MSYTKFIIIYLSVSFVLWASVVIIWLPVRVAQRVKFSGNKYVAGIPKFNCPAAINGCSIALTECFYDFSYFNKSLCISNLYGSSCPPYMYTDGIEYVQQHLAGYFGGTLIGTQIVNKFPPYWRCQNNTLEERMCSYSKILISYNGDCPKYTYIHPQSFNLFACAFTVMFVLVHVPFILFVLYVLSYVLDQIFCGNRALAN